MSTTQQNRRDAGSVRGTRSMRRGWLSRGALICAAGLAALPASGEPSVRSGGIVGQVRNAVKGRPVSGAVISVEGTSAQAESDATGQFVLASLPVGTYRLLITHAGYGPVRKSDLVVNADRDTSADVELFEVPTVKENVEVVASAFERPLEVANSVFGMSYEEVRRAPGALGDVGRMLQSLPGIASHQDERNDIVARGGSPIENLTTVDGIEVPNLNHFASQGASGGAISMLSAETISGLTFIAGGIPSQYGDRLSSALEVSLREGSRRRFQVEADISSGGAGAIVEGPLGKNGSWMASARRSYLDLVAGAFGDQTVPVYSNYLFKGVKDLGNWGRLSLISLGGADSYNETEAQIDAKNPKSHSVDSSAWRSVTGLSLQTFLGTKGALNLTASYAPDSYHADGTERSLGMITSRNRSNEAETTLKGEVALQLGARAVLRAGASVKRFSSHYDLEQPMGGQNDYSTDTTRIDAFATDVRDNTDQESGFAQVTFSPHSRAEVTLGGRVDRYGFTNKWSATPRGSLVLHLVRGLDLSGTYGRYTQMPPFVLMTGIAENRALSLMRADHAIVGLAFTPRSDVKLTLETYDKRYRDYPVSVENPFVSLASLAGFYNVNEILMPMVSRGSGHARGIEFSLQKKLTRSLYAQINYAYSRTEHTALDGVLRPSSYDLPHVLSVVGGWRLSEKFELSSKFAYSSGRPLTPLLLDESKAQDRTILDASRVFAERGPAYHRLDLRADRRFHRSWGTLTLYVEADNVYNRKNVLSYRWNSNKGEFDTQSQLKFLLLGGLTVKF